jgi:probable HAF family extracellular repeat protein
VWAINESGRVLSQSQEPPPNNTLHVVVWDQNGPHEVAPLYGGTIYLRNHKRAMNELGQVVGNIHRDGQPWRAFVWTGGTTVDIGTLGGDLATAEAINNAGQVVGVASDASGIGHAFLWQAGVMQDIGAQLGASCATPVDITDSGYILCRDSSNTRASVWNGTTMEDVSGPTGTTIWPFFINECGVVAGEVTFNTGQVVHQFMWHAGVFVDLGVPSGEVWVSPTDLNNRGDYLVDSGFVLGSPKPMAAYLASWH